MQFFNYYVTNFVISKKLTVYILKYKYYNELKSIIYSFIFYINNN